MQDVTTDGDGEAFDLGLVAADGEGVEQGLGWMLMLAITGVDDSAANFLREEFNSSRRAMTHDEEIWIHGVDCHCRVQNSFALGERR